MRRYSRKGVLSPRRIAGQLLRGHETTDQTVGGRNAGLYSPGIGRTRRAPNVGYDNPKTSADGLMFNDQTDMFNGALDRYNWKLLGKREMYIPYNRSEEHTSELQSLMRISYAVFCLKKKKDKRQTRRQIKS